MSFLAGGGDCAANNNPLAQLSKRAETDTTLHASIRNQTGLNHNGHAIRSELAMDQHNQQMMNSFMDQNHSLHQNTFDFRPVSHELNNVMRQSQSQSQNQSLNQSLNQINNHPSQQQQTSHSSAAWASEFSAANPVMQQPAHMMQAAPNMYRMQNPMMNMQRNMHHIMHQDVQQNVQQNTQQNTQSFHQDSTVDWEDTFKELEDFAADTTTTANINNMQSPLDDVQINASHMMAFNDKYHDEYAFEQNNEFLHNPDAYEIGCKLMDGGAKLSEAALAFEAAVQDDPKHVDAWLKLGQVQTQNEKELKGITALENCLLIDNKNLTALMNLAISYVNEGYDNAAFKTFENWIETKYPDIVSKARNENPNDTSDDRYSLNKRITNLFLTAAQLSPSGANIDADIQTGLGVLFYSMEEYDKTLDCFQAAIRCDPNNALAWNRLGASFANSNRPEQAIEAYSKALQLNPNFVRARYNLGVSFINMGMYKDAVDHLLAGLSMHEVESPDGDSTLVSDTAQSSSLIETLKRAFLAMDRRDLIDKVRPGMNVSQFRNEFNV